MALLYCCTLPSSSAPTTALSPLRSFLWLLLCCLDAPGCLRRLKPLWRGTQGEAVRNPGDQLRGAGSLSFHEQLQREPQEHSPAFEACFETLTPGPVPIRPRHQCPQPCHPTQPSAEATAEAAGLRHQRDRQAHEYLPCRGFQRAPNRCVYRYGTGVTVLLPILECHEFKSWLCF